MDPVEMVRRMAGLAALRLDDDEVDALAGDLADILGHFRVLTEVTDGPGGTGDSALDHLPGPGAESGLRSDEPGADGLAYPPGAAAAGWMAPFFTVPRLASHDERDPGGDG